MSVRHALLAEDLSPGVLRVVEDEGHKLHQRLLCLIASSVRSANLSGCTCAPYANKRQEISLKDQAKNQQDQKTTDPDMHSAEIKSAATTARLVSIVFNVAALSARCPSHLFFL